MSASAPFRMTADEFIAWAMQQPDTDHYELEAGQVVGMAPERAIHTRIKGRVYRRLCEAIETAGLTCEAYIEGLGVQVDPSTVYEPDVLVRCGPPLSDGAMTLDDPVVVVEIRSPSTGYRDAGAKLEGYFRLPSVRHYLIVKTGSRSVIHHERDAAGTITTRIIRDGPIPLDPPGVELQDIFA